MLRVHWNETGHVVVESVVGDKPEVIATLVIEESGDAARKVVHVTVEHDDRAKVQMHA